MPEEPCQCPDCQRFYREHDRLIRESPTLRQQQELNWAALQSFRTLSGRVLEDLQKQHGSRQTADAGASKPASSGAPVPEESADSIHQAIADLEGVLLEATLPAAGLPSFVKIGLPFFSREIM